MSKPEKTLEQTMSFISAVASKQGWQANPDLPFKEQIAKGLTKNYQRYGYFLCPCRDGDGDRASDRDIICPCAYAAADCTEYGHCYCGLFLSPAFAASAQSPASIPERRPAGI